MAAVDLLFGQALPASADLVFNDDGGSAPSTDRGVGGHLALTLPALQGEIGRPVFVNGHIALQMPAAVGEATYRSEAVRPVVAEAGMRWQDGARQQALADARHQDTRPRAEGADQRWQDARRLHARAAPGWLDSRGAGAVTVVRAQDAGRRQAVARDRMADTIRDRRVRAAVRFQEAARGTGRAAAVRDRDTVRAYRPAPWARFREGVRAGAAWHSRVGDALPLGRGLDARYQDAMPLPPGVSSPIEPPAPHLCYYPSPHLVFSTLANTDGFLLFACDGHEGEEEDPTNIPGATVVVPIRRVYMTINSATLSRVGAAGQVPARSMTLALDADSWTWSFSASLPAQAEAMLQPVDGDPVEVVATINSVSYWLVVESMQRDRSFGKSEISIRGRGRSALLDAPYARSMTFGNTGARTIEQLLNEVLTENGVPLGWNVAFELEEDWTVPAGAFSHQGTYIGALSALAAAGGGYLQPTRMTEGVRVLHRYPTAPWNWSSVTPDFELPSAVTAQEGIEWVPKPQYNRVYVSGQASGVLGRYTRAGTAGDLLAPSVVDPLITAAAAVRQRGRAVVADGGRIANVTLRLPVLAATGIIPPGKFVRYTDGPATRFGITRAVSVNVAMPTIYQTIQVETHEPV